MNRPLVISCILLAICTAALAGQTVLSDPKQPWEQLQGTVDFSEQLATGDNVVSCTVFARDAGGNDVDNTVLSWDNSMISGQTTTYWRKGGSDGKKYKITFRCTSNDNVKVEEDVIFTVQEY